MCEINIFVHVILWSFYTYSYYFYLIIRMFLSKTTETIVKLIKEAEKIEKKAN